MNGFATAILSMLLGWLRSFVNNLWRLLGSESGGSFIAFFRDQWKTIFLVLCVGGFVLDRIIYFFRWRPDYVWSTKLGRLKRRLSGKDAEEYEPEAYAPAHAQPDSEAYAPPPNWQRPATFLKADEPVTAQDEYGSTVRYAPPASVTGYAPATQATPSYRYGGEADGDLQPVFDEVTESWTPPAYGTSNAAASSFAPMASYEEPFENPAEDLSPGFGMAKPEPVTYLQDVQMGFAPPPTPQELYQKGGALAPTSARNSAQRNEAHTRDTTVGRVAGDKKRTTPVLSEPVHPGLDVETFQQNIGLGQPAGEWEASDEQAAEPPMRPMVDFPNTTYVPFYQNTAPDTERRRSGLSSLAKKARSLVSATDEDNPPSIRDLQSVVHMKNAFHPPVLPKKHGEGGEE